MTTFSVFHGLREIQFETEEDSVEEDSAPVKRCSADEYTRRGVFRHAWRTPDIQAQQDCGTLD
jgi:hypothetical protein